MKNKVLELLKSLETRDMKPVSYINKNKYIQHNLMVEDGLEGFGKFLQSVPSDAIKVNTIRVFQDNNYVFTHSDYVFLV